MKKKQDGARPAFFVLSGIAFVFIILGLLQGDFFSVMGKAVFICLECIGIG